MVTRIHMLLEDDDLATVLVEDGLPSPRAGDVVRRLMSNGRVRWEDVGPTLALIVRPDLTQAEVDARVADGLASYAFADEAAREAADAARAAAESRVTSGQLAQAIAGAPPPPGLADALARIAALEAAATAVTITVTQEPDVGAIREALAMVREGESVSAVLARIPVEALGEASTDGQAVVKATPALTTSASANVISALNRDDIISHLWIQYTAIGAETVERYVPVNRTVRSPAVTGATSGGFITYDDVDLEQPFNVSWSAPSIYSGLRQVPLSQISGRLAWIVCPPPTAPQNPRVGDTLVAQPPLLMHDPDDGPPTIAYQWRKGTANVGGAGPLLTSVSTAGDHYCRATVTSGDGASTLIIDSPVVTVAAAAQTATAPAKVTGAKAVPGPGTVTVSWPAPSSGGSPITGYKVEGRTGPTGTYATLAVNHQGTSYTDASAPPGTERHYRISAINAVNTGLPSDPVSAVVGEAAAAGILSFFGNPPGLTVPSNVTLDQAAKTVTIQRTSGNTVMSRHVAGALDGVSNIRITATSSGSERHNFAFRVEAPGGNVTASLGDADLHDRTITTSMVLAVPGGLAATTKFTLIVYNNAPGVPLILSNILVEAI